tara:strand:- start:1268 stop:2413 length:1146 start_codon:yes stop_codon:yes gene_type:complete
MKDKLSLMIPGPTPVPESVLKAFSKHPIGHRSKDFQSVVQRTHELLKWLHQTDQEVMTITGSGTAAMESAIINTLSRGDKVICGDNGKFGERWVKVCQAYGLEVKIIRADWGEPLDPEEFKNCLKTDKNIKAVIVTHSETSTGVLNDLELIAKHTKEQSNALVIADCVTSLGACNVPMDKWNIDVVASGSQKGYMMPPGLSFVALSKKAWDSTESSNLPKFYLNLKSYKKSLEKSNTPFTPAVNLYFALESSLIMMNKEGLPEIFKRHERLKRAAQASMESIGLKLFAKKGYGSPAITSVEPVGFNAELIRKIMKDKYDILLAGGQDHLKGKIFRIGHLGFVSDRDLISAVSSLETVIYELNEKNQKIGPGLEAAYKELTF